MSQVWQNFGDEVHQHRQIREHQKDEHPIQRSAGAYRVHATGDRSKTPLKRMARPGTAVAPAHSAMPQPSVSSPPRISVHLATAVQW